MCLIFFFNDTATTEIYTLSLHDALPISQRAARPAVHPALPRHLRPGGAGHRPTAGRGDPPAAPGRRPHQPPHGRSTVGRRRDRKSTRLNSSHANISYAVFCLKTKKVMRL